MGRGGDATDGAPALRAGPLRRQARRPVDRSHRARPPRGDARPAQPSRAPGLRLRRADHGRVGTARLHRPLRPARRRVLCRLVHLRGRQAWTLTSVDAGQADNSPVGTKEDDMTKKEILSMALLGALALPAAAQTLGRGGSLATGGAGPDGAQGASGQLEHCDSPKGTLAVVEPQNQVQASLQRYGLGSPTGVIRMLVQQSNCFQVVERGTGMRSMMQERALAQGGELQNDQNIGKGQMVAADFIVTPSVVFSENNAGGIGGALGGLIGGGGGRALAGLAGGVKFKQAETSMLLVDSRSGIQVASAEGSAEKADFAIGGAVLGGLSAAGGGYGNTNEGKVVVASFL